MNVFKLNVRKSMLLGVGALLAVMPALTTLAQAAGDYPNKPIRLVVPYPPGGPTDLTARVAAAEMANILGQPIVIDN